MNVRYRLKRRQNGGVNISQGGDYLLLGLDEVRQLIADLQAHVRDAERRRERAGIDHT